MEFYKYSANGNDFILLDNFNGQLPVGDVALWQKLCTRRTGVGADGVLFIEKSEQADFHLRYLNADGAEVSMCGNGARAMSDYFYHHINQKNSFTFSTINALYKVVIENETPFICMSELYDLDKIEIGDLFESSSFSYLNTGVPHCVYEVQNIDSLDVMSIGKRIRNDDRFVGGVNVNFYELKPDHILIRTYERGVEAETLSCGTGTVACAHHILKNKKMETLKFISPGGELFVKVVNNHLFYGGEVKKIYKGQIC